MIKTTVKITGKRTWEGPVENWQAHKEVIEHWCEGGGVQKRSGKSDQFFTLTTDNPAFYPSREYRKAQRKPKAGEVFDVGGFICVYHSGSQYPYKHISGDGHSHPVDDSQATLLAPSLAAYYAREFLGGADITGLITSKETRGILNCLLEAAQLEQSDGS